MTSDIPELKVGQVWKAPNGRERRIEHICYLGRGMLELTYKHENGTRIVFPDTWYAWVRKTGARP